MSLPARTQYEEMLVQQIQLLRCDHSSVVQKTRRRILPGLPDSSSSRGF